MIETTIEGLIGILDLIDGDVDLEPDADEEPEVDAEPDLDDEDGGDHEAEPEDWSMAPALVWKPL